MFSHYFAGIGKHFINTIASCIGFIFTLIFGFILIPYMGIVGAGLTASISYLSTVVFQATVFKRLTKSKISEFLITKKDYYLLIREIRELIQRKAQA
jgi:O-antigen/teichoic acid export membrane protein